MGAQSVIVQMLSTKFKHMVDTLDSGQCPLSTVPVDTTTQGNSGK